MIFKLLSLNFYLLSSISFQKRKNNMNKYLTIGMLFYSRYNDHLNRLLQLFLNPLYLLIFMLCTQMFIFLSASLVFSNLWYDLFLFWLLWSDESYAAALYTLLQQTIEQISVRLKKCLHFDIFVILLDINIFSSFNEMVWFSTVV